MTLWFCEVPMSQGCDAGNGYGDSRWCFRRRRYSVERWIPKERGPTEAPGQTGRPPRQPRPAPQISRYSRLTANQDMMDLLVGHDGGAAGRYTRRWRFYRQ